MTHSLHRRGAVEDLVDDFTIIFISARGYNEVNSEEKLKTFLKLSQKHNAVNFGNMEVGSVLEHGAEKVIQGVHDGTTVQATFASEEDFIAIVKDLVEADLGMSVIIQGLSDKVDHCCHEAGVEPHTWNHSLGVWGKTEMLPPEPIMEVTTMCGHGMIAASLVEKVAQDVKKGRLTLDQGVDVIAKPCLCGFVNPVRTRRLIQKMCEDGTF